MKLCNVLLAGLIILASCKNEQIENLSDAKKKVTDYYESGKINDEIKTVIDEAIEKLDGVQLSEKSAAVFDIDETTLSSYNYAKGIDFGYTWETWTEWQLESKAEVMPEVKRLYDYLLEKNFRIIFLTGKRMTTYEAAFKNLMDAGYTKFDTLICRSEKEYKMKAGQYKSRHRQNLTEAGYKIIMCIGDQDSDLSGDNTGIKVKIPNYLYKLD